MTIRRQPIIILLAGLLVVLAACGGSADSTATAPPTSAAAPTLTIPASTVTTPLPVSTATPAPIVEPTTTTPPVASTSPVPSSKAPATTTPAPQIQPSDYRDDRSTPIAVLESLYNAINSKQYARAYSYWEQSESVLPFDQFAKGYANTKHVDLKTGTARVGAALGNLYYEVPVILHVDDTDGSQQIFAGCYMVHLGRPEMQVEPPYHPMAIVQGNLQQVQTDTDASAIFDKGCEPGD